MCHLEMTRVLIHTTLTHVTEVTGAFDMYYTNTCHSKVTCAFDMYYTNMHHIEMTCF